MLGKVDAKGGIVIEKAIREQLGIEPGWETV
jgi:AbrB family looped-hinge helix DNA binding protein